MPGKPHVELWDETFRELLKYRSKFGHCNVPSRYAPNRTLGRWVVNQRSRRKRGDLMPDRERRLLEAGFVFDMGDLMDWQARLRDARRYLDKHGSFPSTGCPVGRWIREQRKSYEMGKLSDEKIHLLEKAGFPWVERKAGLAAEEETAEDCSDDGTRPSGGVGEGEADPTQASDSKDLAQVRRLKKLIDSQKEHIDSQKGIIEDLQRKLRDLEKKGAEERQELEGRIGELEVLVEAGKRETGQARRGFRGMKAVDAAGSREARAADGPARRVASPRAIARALRLPLPAGVG